MTKLQIDSLKDAIGTLKRPIDIAYECSNPTNEDASLWAEVLHNLYEAKLLIEDALDKDQE